MGSAAALTSTAATVSITVNDTVAPVVNAPANVTVNTGAGATTCGAVVTEAQLGTATATDNAGSVSIERSGVPAGNNFPVGTTTITYTATDDAGNSSTATQTVTVVDNTAPTITAPAATSATADGTGHATIPNVVAETTASDNCGPVTVTQSPLAGTVVGPGAHTITITATDAAGNTSTATTTFTVIDGRLTFSFTASPNPSNRGKTAKIDIVFTNNTTVNEANRFLCGALHGANVIAESSISLGQYRLPRARPRQSARHSRFRRLACTGPYVLALEAYIGNVLVGTATTDLTVAPEQMKGRPDFPDVQLTHLHFNFFGRLPPSACRRHRSHWALPPWLLASCSTWRESPDKVPTTSTRLPMCCCRLSPPIRMYEWVARSSPATDRPAMRSNRIRR